MVQSNNNVVVLISGNGSNLQALIDHQTALGYKICEVISNKEDAYGLQRARQANISTKVIDRSQYEERAAFDHALQRQINAFSPQLVVLAGFMCVLGQAFTKHFEGKILNIHPSLLPAHKGLHTHKKVIENGDLVHGASVHFVTSELDGGPLVMQATVPVLPEDTEESLKKRVLEQEHCIYPLSVAWFIAGRLKMDGQFTWLDNMQLPAQGYQFEGDVKMLPELISD